MKKPSRVKGSLSTTKFDSIFDSGKDVSAHLDASTVKRVGHAPHRVSVDAPAWLVQKLDREASRLGITRQALIKVWLADRLEKIA